MQYKHMDFNNFLIPASTEKNIKYITDNCYIFFMLMNNKYKIKWKITYSIIIAIQGWRGIDKIYSGHKIRLERIKYVLFIFIIIYC